jgi:hypothetical protein
MEYDVYMININIKNAVDVVAFAQVVIRKFNKIKKKILCFCY